MRHGIEFGKYHLLGRLNAGGMAEVFLGKVTGSDSAGQLLAIKRMLPRLTSDPDFVSMFNDEARIASGLSHANICGIVDRGQIGETLFIAMEFIHGKDLKVVQSRAKERGEPVPPRYVAYATARIAEALNYAHNKTNDAGEPESIVHRDISPQNILISYDGTPKLIDFGIAKARDRIVKTKVGVVKGKFAYMSPEQATGQPVDKRTDLFALGVVIYQLITGSLPFKGASDFSTLKKIALTEFTPIEELASDVPPRLIAVIKRALARNPEDRYPSGEDMAADLDRFLADERREVTDTTLSSYMRKLFRDDYIRETSRIKKFLTFKPPKPGEKTDTKKSKPSKSRARSRSGKSNRRDAAVDNQTESTGERELNQQSRILAAGYDGTDVTDIEAELDGTNVVSTTAEVISPSDIIENDEGASLVTAPGEFIEKTTEFRSPYGLAGELAEADDGTIQFVPADGAAANEQAPDSEEPAKPFFPGAEEKNSGGSTPQITAEKTSDHFGAKTVEYTLPDDLLQPDPDGGLGRDRIATQEIDDAIDSILDLTIPSDDSVAIDDVVATTDDIDDGEIDTSDFDVEIEDDSGGPTIAGNVDIIVDASASPPDDDVGEFDSSTDKHEIPPAGMWDDEDGTREMDVSEVNTILAEASEMEHSSTAPDHAALKQPDEPDRSSDPAQPALEVDADKLNATTAPEPTLDGVDAPDGEVEDSESTLIPEDLFDDFEDDIEDDIAPAALNDSGRHRAKAADSSAVLGASESQPRVVSRPPRKRWLTELEIAILVFVAALGLATVVGAYWWATTQPIDQHVSPPGASNGMTPQSPIESGSSTP